MTVTQIRKRDGSIIPFESNKIEQAIYKALMATRAGDKKLAAELARRVVAVVEAKFAGGVPEVYR